MLYTVFITRIEMAVWWFS